MRDRDIIKICYLFYNEGMSQVDIGDMMGLSRWKVGRVIKAARERELISISINHPQSDLTEIEIALAKKYGLKEAIVVDITEFDRVSPLDQLGVAGARYLTPIIVQSKSIRDTIFKETRIRETIEIARKADLVIFGVGLVGPESLLWQSGLLNECDATKLKMAGAVGAICGRFYDDQGVRCSHDLEGRIIGLNLNELKKIKHKILIAAGLEKFQAILGALRGDLVDALVIDSDTAEHLLKI